MAKKILPGNKSVKHGLSGTKVYRAWQSMKSRCYNPNHSSYPDYGAKGIKVCDRWRNSFELFFEDIGHPPTPNHSIDRIDCTGNYEPGNCRWATIECQSRNKTNNTWIEYDAKRMTATDWARELGIKPCILFQYFRQGLTLAEVIERRAVWGRTNLDVETTEKLKAAFLEGKHIGSAASEIGVSFTTAQIAYSKLEKHYDPIQSSLAYQQHQKWGQTRLDAETKKVIEESFHQGKRIRDVAKELGVNKNTVWLGYKKLKRYYSQQESTPSTSQ